MCVCVCVCVCICVCTPSRPQIPIGVILTLNDWLNNFDSFSVGPAINVIDRRGPSNEMRYQLHPKKTKVRLYWPFI